MSNVLKKREKVILCLTIIIVIFSIAFHFVIGPVLEKYDALAKEVNVSESRLKKYLALLNRKGEIQNQYGRFSSNADSVMDGKDAPSITMANLENLAKSAGIKIIDIRPETSKKGDLIVIELRTEGAVDSYGKFIYDIETSLFLLKIKRLQFTAKTNTASLEGVFTISQPVILK
jgi:hypothetical protein